MSKQEQNSEIKLNIALDENKIPQNITWEGEGMEATECKAFLLSLFDKDTKETFKIDLWTKEMEVREMDRFFYHTLSAMSDTYMKATNNQELVAAFKSFVNYFGEKVEVIKPESEK